MNHQQKITLAVLAAIALIILAMTGLAALFLLALRAPAAIPGEVVAVVTPLPSATPPLTATPVALPTAASNPSPTAKPTPLPTRVVVVTVQPTITATPLNCITNIVNFEASGQFSNEQVADFLRRTIPPLHLDHCRIIEYVPVEAELHATPVSGSFLPILRRIQVYALAGSATDRVELLITLTHEIGHNVHYNLRRSNWETARRWTELYRDSQTLFARQQTGFVSPYAQTSEFEDFAESYAAYILTPDLLKRYSPDKYEFMRLEVFDEVEYGE